MWVFRGHGGQGEVVVLDESGINLSGWKGRRLTVTQFWMGLCWPISQCEVIPLLWPSLHWICTSPNSLCCVLGNLGDSIRLSDTTRGVWFIDESPGKSFWKQSLRGSWAFSKVEAPVRPVSSDFLAPAEPSREYDLHLALPVTNYAAMSKSLTITEPHFSSAK